MAEYIGITIGPIFDTLLLAHSPCAMWFASKIFSGLTESICRKLYGKVEIFSPHFDSAVQYKDGVGRYHDRIIVKSESKFDIDAVIVESENEMATTVAAALGLVEGSDQWKETVEFIIQYLQVHWIKLSEDEAGEGFFRKISTMLDSLEQLISPNIFESNNNPFKQLFKGRVFRNDNVKAYIKKEYPELWLLDDKNNLRCIEDIAGKKDGFKRSEYFAVVEADGDGVGSYINSLGSKVKDFSKKCFSYADEAHKMITDYGAMTVYAGGDDLLFVAPVYNDGKTVFDLCNEIRDAFRKTVAVGTDTPSVSFGIAIRYERFPLYETLNSSIDALYYIKNCVKGKDATVIDFMKGSGQAIKIMVPNEEYSLFKDIISSYTMDTSEDGEKSNLYSLIYALGKNKYLFDLCANDKMIEHLMDNTFDNDAQKSFDDFIKVMKNRLTAFKSSMIEDLSMIVKDNLVKSDGISKDGLDAVISSISQFNDVICLSYGERAVQLISEAVGNALKGKDYSEDVIEKTVLGCYNCINGRRRIRLTDDGNNGDYIKAFESLLRLSKFFIEKAGKKYE